MAEQQPNLKIMEHNFSSNKKTDAFDAVESSDIPFLYNGQFLVLTFLCSMPLLYFGGERLFGIGTICLLTVYIFHLSFNDTKSSVIGFVICVAIMQFSILYSIGPLLWESIFNIFFLLVYNVFIILTGGLGLIQFEVFRRDEVDFCSNVEYFLFLLYPPCCVLILMWLISWRYGGYLAPYLSILIGFPMCHTMLDQKFKPSFGKSGQILGQPERMLALFNFAFFPSFAYCLVNFSHLLHYSSWISILFCICIPLFLITFLDTRDLRDLADIRDSQWRFLQVFTGCLSLILGTLLAHIHGIVDEVNAVFLATILLCSVSFFLSIKYKYSNVVSTVACGLLATFYVTWFSTLPWNLVFSLGSEIRFSFFTVELLVSILGILSVLAVAVSVTVRYRSSLNQILALHTSGFVVIEVILTDSEVYSPYLMILTGIFIFYLVQRLHQVGRLNKSSAVICTSLHGSKLLLMFILLNTKPEVGGLSSSLGLWSGSLVTFAGFCLCATLSNVLFFERGKELDKEKIFGYIFILFGCLVVLSSTLVRTLCIILIHGQPSAADIVGCILISTAACFVKLSFLHSENEVARKQSVLLFLVGFLVLILQPYFNIFEILLHMPKLMLREIIYNTWQVVFAEYLFLPLCMLLSLTLSMVLLLKLIYLKEMSSLSLDIISFTIGAPLGLCIAHWVLPYPKLPSSILVIPYMLSTSLTTNSLLLAFKNQSIHTNVKKYIMFLVLSISSIAMEMAHNICINILQSEIPPGVLFQTSLHLITIIQVHSQLNFQITLPLDKKDSLLPGVAHSCSVLLVFFGGLIFSPTDYYDILIVPVCGCLLMLRMQNFQIIKNGKGQQVIKRVLFAVVLGSILYYRTLQQLPFGKWGFWTAIAFVLEISVIICSFLVFLIIISALWHQYISTSEGLALAVFAPVFTLMLFYGRTSAGQVLGIVGPALAYAVSHYPVR